MMGSLISLGMLALAGAGLLAVADRVRRKSQTGAQVLAVLGVGLLFLMIWDANYSGFVYGGFAFALIFSVVMLAGLLAVRHGYPMPILAVLGAFVVAAEVSLERPPPFDLIGYQAFGHVVFMAAILFGLLFIPTLITWIPWRRVAPRLGLELHLSVPPASPWLEGTLRGFDVKVFQHENTICISVGAADPGFTLRRESALSKVMGGDVETGDPAFDARTLIEGDQDCVLALLDFSVRRKVGLLLEQRYDRISEGEIRKKVFKFWEIQPALESMLDLAEALRPVPRTLLPQLLSQRALEDPSPGVRLRAFQRLDAAHFRDDQWRETANALRDSDDEPLRLAACRALLREPGSATAEAAGKLMDIVRQSSDLSLRVEALDAVAGTEFAERHVTSMAALLQGEDNPALRLAALRGLAGAGALDELLLVELSDDPDEAVELARGLGQIGDVRAQPRLFELLAHPRDRVKAEAAEALGLVGDVRAVEELRKALDSGFLAKLSVGGAAESAIAQIQGRLGGSQAGEISLAKEDGSPLQGAVSRADGSEPDDSGGEVSLA